MIYSHWCEEWGAAADLWISVPGGRETTFEHGLVLISMGGRYDHLAAGSCHFSIKPQSAAFLATGINERISCELLLMAREAL